MYTYISSTVGLALLFLICIWKFTADQILFQDLVSLFYYVWFFSSLRPASFPGYLKKTINISITYKKSQKKNFFLKIWHNTSVGQLKLG